MNNKLSCIKKQSNFRHNVNVALISICMLGAASNAYAAKNFGEIFLEELGRELLKTQQQSTQTERTRQSSPESNTQTGSTQVTQVQSNEPILPEGVAPYEGSARFLQDINLVRLGEGGNLISYDKVDSTFTLTESSFFKEFLPPKSTEFPTLICLYKSTKSGYTKSTYFWYKYRPEIDINKEPNKLRFGKGYVLNDIAVSACPQTWGEVRTLVWGEGANERVAEIADAADQKIKKDIAEYQQNISNAETAWMQGNLIANSKAVDTQLANQIATNLKDMWDHKSKYDTNISAFTEDIQTKIDPLMVKLARSGLAQARKIPKGKAGYKQFEAWDNGIGYTVFYLNWVLQKSFFKDSTYNTQSGPIWRYYINLYKEQLRDKGVIEQSYMTSILTDIKKYEDSSVSASRPIYSSFNKDHRFTLNGDETPAYKAVSSAVHIIQARTEIKRLLSESTAAIEKARQDFWNCYEKRCNQGAKYYLEYSDWLIEKDRWNAKSYYTGEMYNKLSEGMKGHTSQGSYKMKTVLGIEESFDGGQIFVCTPEWNSFLGKIDSDIRSNGNGLDMVFNNPISFRKSFSSSQFTKYQECRDQMEFVMRDSRKSKKGYVTKF